MAENNKTSRFVIERLEDRIAPSSMSCCCGSGKSHKSRKSHKSNKCKSSKKSHKSNKSRKCR